MNRNKLFKVLRDKYGAEEANLIMKQTSLTGDAIIDSAFGSALSSIFHQVGPDAIVEDKFNEDGFRLEGKSQDGSLEITIYFTHRKPMKLSTLTKFGPTPDETKFVSDEYKKEKLGVSSKNSCKGKYTESVLTDDPKGIPVSCTCGQNMACNNCPHKPTVFIPWFSLCDGPQTMGPCKTRGEAFNEADCHWNKAKEDIDAFFEDLKKIEGYEEFKESLKKLFHP